jgi:hypothetical protein
MFKIIVHKRALKYLAKLTSFRKTKIKELLFNLAAWHYESLYETVGLLP